MQDKKVFRLLFNFFEKYRDKQGLMDKERYWSDAAQEMGQICTELGNTDFVTDLFAAIYQELERRDEQQAQR